MGLAPGAVWEATSYARFRVALRSVDGQEDRVVHRWLRAGEQDAESIALEDALMLHKEPLADFAMPPSIRCFGPRAPAVELEPIGFGCPTHRGGRPLRNGGARW